MRNGNRWRVSALDAERAMIVARHLDDDARAAFGGAYLREHVTLGYEVASLDSDTHPRMTPAGAGG